MQVVVKSPSLLGAGMIGNLQALRAIAALTVAIGHAGLWLGSVGPVETFFVISGFIMCFISEKDASNFLPRRVIRIAPFYWLCTALYLLVVYRWAFLRFWGWHPDFALRIAHSLAFIPGNDPPSLGVGWTLNLEMYFYAVFAVALAISRRWAPIITATAIISVILIHAAGCTLLLCNAYAAPSIPYFVAGIALFYVWRPIGRALPRSLAAFATVSGLVACYAGWIPVGSEWLPIIVVALALLAAGAGADLQWQSTLLLGDASYAIYLTHPTVIELAHRYSITSVPLLAVLCMSAGIAAHVGVEKPVYRWLLAKYRSRVPVKSPA